MWIAVRFTAYLAWFPVESKHVRDVSIPQSVSQLSPSRFVTGHAFRRAGCGPNRVTASAAAFRYAPFLSPARARRQRLLQQLPGLADEFSHFERSDEVRNIVFLHESPAVAGFHAR